MFDTYNPIIMIMTIIITTIMIIMIMIIMTIMTAMTIMDGWMDVLVVLQRDWNPGTHQDG